MLFGLSVWALSSWLKKHSWASPPESLVSVRGTPLDEARADLSEKAASSVCLSTD